MNQIMIVSTAVVFLSSTFSWAQDVQLTLKKHQVRSAQASVVRTSNTPKKVRLTLSIPFSRSVCVQHDTRMVYGRDSSCGYDTHYETRTHCSNETVCTVWKDGQCKASKTERSCSTESVPVSEMRSCYHPETYCVQYGTVTELVDRTVVLNFKKLDTLKSLQEERFFIEGSQKTFGSTNAVFRATVLNTLEKIKVETKSLLGTDRLNFKKDR